jgi:hypothetical protein
MCQLEKVWPEQSAWLKFCKLGCGKIRKQDAFKPRSQNDAESALMGASPHIGCKEEPLK